MNVKPLIHPQHFQWGWDLPSAQVAESLAIEVRTFHGYNTRSETAHRNPPRTVQRLASILTELWIVQGKKPPHPEFLCE